MAKKIYGIIGHPISHTLSPAMQNAAFASAGIGAEYLAYDVRPEDLVDFLDSVRQKGISGLNVTIPHKVRAKEYLEKKGSLDENARRLGAVNTIKAGEDGRLCGYNTDGPGFYRSLVEDLGFEPEGKNILVLGAGGAASAVVMYLGNGPKKIFVTDIDAKRAADLAKRYGQYFDAKRISAIDVGQIKKTLAGTDLVVNATPAGMNAAEESPIDVSFLRAGLYVYDLVYNQPMTALLKAAQRAKCHAVTGLGMLLYQGAIAFEIWTGQRAPVDVMRKALKAAIRGAGPRV